MTLTRRRILSATGAALALPALAQSPAGQPVRIGSTLALTGPLSATALTHKLVGEIYVEQLNKRGGLLGRQVQWIVKDDQSKPDLARTLYEQLVTSDKVDLLIGPYATGNILSAMGVAQRYDKVLPFYDWRMAGYCATRQAKYASTRPEASQRYAQALAALLERLA